MNVSSKFKSIFIKLVVVFILISVVGCSSPEEKANKFYENGMQLLEKGELIKANVEFRNALQLNRKLTKAIWGQVLVAEKQNKPRQQYKLLNAVLINEPQHIDALIKLGRLLLLANQLDKALEKSNLAIKIDKENLSVLSLQSAILLKLDNTSEAVKISKQILVKDPTYIDAIMILATERLGANDPANAIKYIDQGLKYNSKNIALLLIKIKSLEKIEKLDEAEEVFNRLIDYYPKIEGFKTALAQFYIKYNRNDDAENIYFTIVKNNPHNISEKIKLVKFISSTRGPDAGLKQLQKFSKENPNDNELKFAIVQFYLSINDTNKAISILEEIVNEKPATEVLIKAKGIMAASMLATGNKNEAEKIVSEILSIDKQNQNGLILKASLDIDRQNYEAAIAALRLVLRDTPDSSRALYFLVSAHNLSGSSELADKQYQKAFSTSNFNSTYGLKYAEFLIKRKQPKRAEKVLQDILTIHKGGVPLSVLKLLAQTRILLGDWIGAEQVADVIKQTGDNNNLASQISNAILLGKKDYSESISLLKKSYQTTPGNIQPVAGLVKTYLLAGKVKEAESFLDAVISASPNNVGAQILRGQVYSAQGKAGQAISVYENLINSEPQNAESYYHLAVIYIRDKNYNKAAEILNKGLSLVPKSFSIGMTLAQTYEKTGEKDKAIKAYDIVANNLASLLTENKTDIKSLDKAYRLSLRFKQSEIPQFKDTYGWASHKIGKYADANDILQSAIKELPNNPYFHYHLGMNFVAQKNTPMAKKELEKALKLAGDVPFDKAEEIRSVLEKL